MKIRILYLAISLWSVSLIAQSDSAVAFEIDNLKNEFMDLSKKLDSIKSGYYDLNKKLVDHDKAISVINVSHQVLTAKVDSVSSFTSQNRDMLVAETVELRRLFEEIRVISNGKIAALNRDVYKNKLYWISGMLATLLIGSFVFWLLGKRITSSKTDVESKITSAKKALEEESIKLDSKLVEILESQLKIKQAELSSTSSSVTHEKEDHSLALKVADEIVRMQKNIARMDEGTKGLKPLEKGIERIQSNFAANGYEMVNILNKEYEDRMNLDVINFLEDENLEKGKKIITKIIKPQVNFNGVLIQRAQVEVSQN